MDDAIDGCGSACMRWCDLQRVEPAAAIRRPFRRRAVWVAFVLVLVGLTAACDSLLPSSSPQSSSGNGQSAGITYYLSPAGNDAAKGTSPATAWRTLGHASRVALRPGDRLLLHGGSQFSGQLTIGPGDADDAAHPLAIGSYGPGMAIITSTGAAIYVHDTAGIDISDLNLVGKPPAGHSGGGLTLYNDLSAGRQLEHVTVDHVDVSGFYNGISFGGKNGGAGFGDVRISNCTLSNNIDTGLSSYGPPFNAQSPSYANWNVSVSDVTSFSNHGDPQVKTHNTGNGIVLGSVRDGTIIGSTAHDNGGSGGGHEGPAGIWTYDSTGVDIERNLSYNNRTPNRVDGNGFGLDQNTSDSIMQRNLSHGNAGTGYLVYSPLKNNAEKDDVIQYNISSDDARDGTIFYGGITVDGIAVDVDIRQNTVVMTPSPLLPIGIYAPALRLSPGLSGANIRNNIFATNYGPVVADTVALKLTQANLEGNDYFIAFGPWSITWGSASYGSLAEWRSASSEETAAGHASGFTVDPETVGPVVDIQSKLAANDATAGRGFAMRAGSALIGAGLKLTDLHVSPEQTNYAGEQVSASNPNVGAM
jgi:hypothetical protein